MELWKQPSCTKNTSFPQSAGNKRSYWPWCHDFTTPSLSLSNFLEPLQYIMPFHRVYFFSQSSVKFWRCFQQFLLTNSCQKSLLPGQVPSFPTLIWIRRALLCSYSSLCCHSHALPTGQSSFTHLFFHQTMTFFHKRACILFCSKYSLNNVYLSLSSHVITLTHPHTTDSLIT